jgi:Uncharacterized protein conserved in bacteria
VIRDAVHGKAPRVKLFSLKGLIAYSWPLLLGFSLFLAMIYTRVINSDSVQGSVIVFLLSVVLTSVAMIFGLTIEQNRVYAQQKELFAAFEANPDLYRDEILKAAVSKLPSVDFYGKHATNLDNSKIGRYEAEIIEGFRQLGIRQEVTVANRGRPFLIHQYQLKELGWGKWENGDSKNYTLDIAILWPERRIKYNVEIDDPSHAHRLQKDIRRDEILTERGWFIRRLNHNFLANEEKKANAPKEITGIVYFFAKYADDESLDWIAWLQAKMFNVRLKIENQ